MTSPPPLDLPYDLWKTYYIVNYASIALLSLLICEWFRTLPQEIRNIWMGKWVGINAIYLMCRYIPFLVILLGLQPVFSPSQICTSIGVYASMWLSIFGLIVSEISFILRVYALWGASRLVAVFLFILAVGLTCSLVVTSLRPITMPISIRNGETSFTCTSINGRGHSILLVALVGSLIVLLIDTVVTCMAIWAIKKKYHVHDKSNRLLRKMRRDAITYFCNNCLVVCISFVFCMVDASQALVPLRIGSVLTNLLASAMILDLRDYANYTSSFSQDLAVAYPMSELSALRFVACESQADE